ncbi:hypothetical protein AMJ80_11885, partial [bacterium SM23_31]
MNERGENLSDAIVTSFDFDLISYCMSIDISENLYILTKYVPRKPRNEIKMTYTNALLEMFSPEENLLHFIPIRSIFPNYVYVGAGNKIYLNDSKPFTVIRSQSLFLTQYFQPH